MSVINVQVGRCTSAGFQVATEVSSTADVRVAVGTSPALSSPVYFGPVTPTTQGTHFVAKVDVTGLSPSTHYYYAVEHNSVLDTAFPGEVPSTLPVEGVPSNFRLGVGGDAGLSPTTAGTGTVLAANRLSNHVTFAQIADRASAEQWVGMVHLGDLHYYDLSSGQHGISGGESVANFRRAISDVLLQTNQHRMFRDVPTVKIQDDHDFLGNNSDGSSNPTGAGNWAQVYREREPHYDLEETAGGIHHSFVIGRVCFIVTDSRFYASPDGATDDSSKTMWGADQQDWVTFILATTAARAVVVLTSRQWLRTSGSDTWFSFSTERSEIIGEWTELGWIDRICMVHADRHAFHLQQPPHEFGGFPVLGIAPFDAANGSSLSDYPDGVADVSVDDTSQYGTVDVADDGQRIEITLTGWYRSTVLGSYTMVVPTPSPAVIANKNTWSAITSGSHQFSVEARALDTYQDGGDPTGVDIPIISGDVQLDSTADVRGTLSFETPGKGRWPQRASDLLAPFGNEVFVRRGVHLGAQTLWAPLGYYRIKQPEQSTSPDGPISVSGMDRMSQLIVARLLSPRAYPATTQVFAVFDELVKEVYPGASILFDDDAVRLAQLGRAVESEDARYGILREIAESFGKIMFFDTEGLLRIESAPDPTVPVWKFAAGRRGGVLIEASRSLSDEGVFNAVVVTGEGADSDTDPVRAVAIDNSPRSPTYFFGRFGPVPTFYTSPLITTQAQATTVAESILRRNLGFPYNVDFTTVVNPAIRPLDPVQMVLNDGTHEVHVIESITIPLDAGTSMTGSTKEQTIVTIGSL